MEAPLSLNEITKPIGSLANGDTTHDSGKVDVKINGQVNGEACGDPADKSSAHQGQAGYVPRQSDAEPIAIVGMACRFPGDAVSFKGL